MKFTWDINKEKINIYKHGVNFEQASYVFSDPFALNLFDSEHSDDESRWILVGKSINETITIVVHTFENEHGIEFKEKYLL